MKQSSFQAGIMATNITK